MIRVAIIGLFLLTFNSIVGQVYKFTPKWKKGDQKNISVARTEKEFRNDIIVSDTTIYSEASIHVLKEDKENYTIEIIYENVALKAAIEFYDKLGEELKSYQNLKLIYQINKETAEYDLINSKEVKKFMDQSFDAITEILEEKVPDIAPLTGLFLKPVIDLFDSKENIEAYMESEIGYLLTPFNKNFQLGESISITETAENPFDPSHEVSSTVNLKLESVEKDIAIIQQEVVLDLSEFKEMIKKLMTEMNKSFEGNDSIMEVKKKELDDFDMNMINEQDITFDMNSTWVTKVFTTTAVTSADPKKGMRKKEIVSVVTIE